MSKTNIDFWKKIIDEPSDEYKELFLEEEKYLRGGIHDNESILDVGCGDGRNILSIIDISENITGIDIDDGAIDSAKEKLANHLKVKLIKGSAFEMPFDDCAFDVAILSMTLGNFDDKKEATLLEMKRVIKNDGRIILSIYSEKSLEKRLSMYKTVRVPIEDIMGGKVIFHESVGAHTSEQFSIDEITKLVESVGLKIIKHKEVAGLAYFITLQKDS